MKKKEIIQRMKACFARGNKVWIIGNGGSSSESSHFSEELISHGLPAIALNDPSVITALANDFNYEQVFARYLAAVARKGDVVILLSTSGKSMNLLLVIEWNNKLSFGWEIIEWPRNKGETTEEIQNHQLKLIHEVYRAIIK